LFYLLPALAQVKHNGSHAAAAAPARASPPASYVGSEACSRCHLEIYNHFVQTKMGRSASAVTPEFLRSVPLPVQIYEQKSDHHFEVATRNGRLYQSEYQLDASGHEVFRDERAIDWIVGANMNGLSGLIHKDGYVFEAPLSYFRQTATWDLSPGYQHGDYGFSRVVVPGCISCHTGRPQPVAGSDGKYADRAFAELAVGCENCHGPGSAHVDAMETGASYTKGKDPTIVNPAALKPALANDLCESCHQTGDVRLYQPGKTYQDFRPGMPLNRITAILMIPPTKANPPSDEHVEHYYSMILSKCYLASAQRPADKQMRCISCHDPHIEPTAAEAPAYFNSKCMSCHTQQSCKATAVARQQTAPADNCIGCHMPKRAESAISHTTLTNHRIIARPGEPFPEEAFKMTTAAMPDLIYVDAGSAESTPLPAITRLKAYEQLKDRDPGYEPSFLKTLHELEQSPPADAAQGAVVEAALGHQALGAQQWDAAVVHLQAALKFDPAQPAVLADLSTIADARGQAEEAVNWQQKAVALDPYNEALQKVLVSRLINAKEYPQAEEEMEKYVEEFPEDDFMRKMLSIAKSQ
jgi:hypothetical protein